MHTHDMVITDSQPEEHPDAAQVWRLVHIAGVGSPTALAKMAGLSPSTLNRIVNNTEPSRLKAVTVEQIERAIEAKLAAESGAVTNSHSPAHILTQASRHVPVISWIKAGQLSVVADPYLPGDALEWVDVTYHRATLIALRVEGDSMNLAGAPHGSVIIVDYTDTDLISGQLYVFRDQNDEAAFKRYRDNPHRLEPVSTEQHDTVFPETDIDVIGHVVRIFTDPTTSPDP